MDKIKDSFERVRLDIDYLNHNLHLLKEEIDEMREMMITFVSEIQDLKKKLNNEDFSKREEIKKKINENENKEGSLNFKIPKFKKSKDKFSFSFINNPLDTSFDTSTDTSTGNQGVKTNKSFSSTNNVNFKPLNDQILRISTGNRGVQTDRQTNQQTDISTQKSSYNQEKSFIIKDFYSHQNKEESTKKEEETVDKAVEILDSLDSIKKELRLKFKRLTDQEWKVFSAIYQLEEENGYVTYKMLSKKLKLTESSIRDYSRRLITKKIPILKEKINNKEIVLKISPNLRKIISLESLLELKSI